MSERTRTALHLYLVTDHPDKCHHSLLETVKRAVAGGVTMVQYRRYGIEEAALIEEATPLRDYLREAGVPFIINNNLRLAQLLDADGLHIGQRDISPEKARAGLGAHKIIGLTVANEEQLRAAPIELLDYLGMGPVFPTITKENAAPALGIAEFSRLASLSTLPVVGIGGLDVERVRALRATGAAAGVAMVSAICASADPRAAAESLS